MMKKIYTLLIALFFVGGVMGQTDGTCETCLPDGISFTTQAQIDNFQMNYPNCTEIGGWVKIWGDGITNLNGLNVVTSIDGWLHIGFIATGTSLINLTGLDNLTSVGGGVAIIWNNSLTSLTALEGLTSIEGSLWIYGNDALTNLTGLDNVTSIGGDLIFGYSINGFSYGNPSLTSLSGIANINPSSIQDMKIYNNTSLSECEVLSICEYLVAPNGTILMGGNAIGCNSPEEVLDSCEANAVDIPEQIISEFFSIYPNPSSSKITIELPTQPSKNTTLTLTSTNGQQLITQPITKPQTEIDISHLPTGIYIVKVWNDKDVMVQKVIKQ